MPLPIINIATTNSLIRLLDFCYKRGVIDAHYIDDEGKCREFINETSQVGKYGFIVYDYYMDWLEWQLRLEFYAKLTSFRGALSHYFDRMNRFGTNFLSCCVPLAQMYYNKGLKDYCDAPIENDIEKFKTINRAIWTGGGLVQMNAIEMVRDAMLKCLDLKHRDAVFLEENPDSKTKRLALRESYYDNFIKLLGAIVNEVRAKKFFK